MKSLLLIAALLICEICAANIGWWFVGRRDGITIIVPCPYNDSIKERKQQEAFLNFLVKKLNRKDTSLKILLLVNPMVMYPGMAPSGKWFASIAYDTLRKPDNNFIDDYNSYRSNDTVLRHIVSLRNLPSDKYKIDLPEPLDINSSYNTDVHHLGLKVICGYVHWDSTSSYDKFYSLIRYGINHIEEIKRNQKRIVIPFHLNDIQISLITLDTGVVKSIPIISMGFDPKIPERSMFRWTLVIVILGALLIMVFVLIAWRRLTKDYHYNG